MMFRNRRRRPERTPDEGGEQVRDQSHSAYVLFLICIGLLALISLAVKGWSYYLTPVDERPFHEAYATMKPSGNYTHGLGIIGATQAAEAMKLIAGVGTSLAGYSPFIAKQANFLLLGGAMLITVRGLQALAGVGIHDLAGFQAAMQPGQLSMLRPILDDARIITDKAARHPGVFIRDAIKPGAAEVISQLHRQGLGTYLVTGDNSVTVQTLTCE